MERRDEGRDTQPTCSAEESNGQRDGDGEHEEEDEVGCADERVLELCKVGGDGGGGYEEATRR